MIELRGFSKNDLLKINIQEAQKHELGHAGLPCETCFTLVDGEDIVGIFGVVEQYKGRGTVFAYVSANAGKNMVAVVRKLKRLIDDGMKKTDFERLEMSVLDGFVAGQRMAEMLGFEYEGLMRKYYKGRNYKLYARVK